MSAASKRIWFLDTSSLLSMALDEEIEAAVLDEIGNDPVMIIDIVRDELTRRAAVPGTDGLAKAALNCLQSRWTVMDTARFVKLEDIRLAQEDVADGRTLSDDMQHWQNRRSSPSPADRRQQAPPPSRCSSARTTMPAASPAPSRTRVASAFTHSFTNASNANA